MYLMHLIYEECNSIKIGALFSFVISEIHVARNDNKSCGVQNYIFWHAEYEVQLCNEHAA